MTAPRTAGVTIVAGAAFLLGLGAGAALWQRPPVTETAAPAVRQRDSSLVLERAPDPTARAPHAIPRGAVLERIAAVVVQPDSGVVGVPRETFPDAPGTPALDTLRCACAPVTVDLSLVREANGMRRVIASARGGTVIGGLDVPVESATPPRPLRWALGGSYDPLTRRWGASLDRDVDRLGIPFLRIPARLGVSVTPHGAFTESGAPRTAVALRVSIRF